VKILGSPGQGHGSGLGFKGHFKQLAPAKSSDYPALKTQLKIDY